jgi:tetratricopeptide (TPR) repeat protein
MLHVRGSTEQLYHLAIDRTRRERLVALTGGDAAVLTEINAALDLLANDAVPDLVKICLLAHDRDTLRITNDQLHTELLEAWVHLGQFNRALAAAQARSHTAGRDRALAAVAEAAAINGRVEEAITVANAIADVDYHDWSLRAVSRAIADSGDLDRAISVSQTITDGDTRAWAVAGIVEAAARADNEHRARQIVEMLNGTKYLAKALASIAHGTNGALSDLQHKQKDVATTRGEQAAQVGPLVKLALAAATAGDPERATDAIRDAERAARAVSDGRHHRYHLQALCMVASAAAQVGETALAEQLVNEAEQTLHRTR